MKYSAVILPLSQARAGDLIVQRRVTEGDRIETVVLRPKAGEALVFGSDGMLVTSTITTTAALAAAVALLQPLEAVQTSTPVTGATVVMTDSTVNGTLALDPAGTLATLTVTLPTNANSRIGQIRRVVTSQIITALTIDGATTIGGNITTMAANAFVSFQKIAANTWRRIG